MKLGIMQPYFLPYIGYFQLINCVDEFVIYDDIQYSKKGWINRNRVLSENGVDYITLPLRKDSDFLNVSERKIAETYNRKKTLDKIASVYRKAPYYNEVVGLIESIFFFQKNDLFEYILHSVMQVNDYLKIDTKMTISSSIEKNNSLKSQAKVLEICSLRGATEYINAIGGVELYDKKEFISNNIELFFLQTNSIEYRQFGREFSPWLSILDVLMFNSRNEVIGMLHEYKLI